MRYGIETLHYRNKNKKQVQPSVRICFDCGSSRTNIENQSITCMDCGVVRNFNNNAHEICFKKGDLVRIIDSEKNSDIIYKIKKMKKSHDGTKLYLLKSTSSKISLLYYESPYSYLEKVEYYPIKGK